MKKLKLISIFLIIMMLTQVCAFAAPRIPVYKVGNVLYFLDKASGTITGFAGDPKDLIIPTTLGGYNVVSIGAGAFSGSHTLETLAIPDGISTIAANAFSSCPNLKSVTVGATVSYIGSRAFADCPSLSSISFAGTPATVESDALENSSWISGSSTDFVILGDTLLKYNGTAESVTVPDGVKSIAANAFAYNTAIKEVYLPEMLQKIGDNAFVHCYSLKTISIPKTVSHIGAGAFDDTIWMASQPDDLVMVNGILISYKGSDSHIELPEGITAIGAGAFMANTSILSVHLPQSVVYIDSMAFGGCSSLLLANIPDSVEWVDEYAFAGCSNITVYGSQGAYSHKYAEYMEVPFSGEVYVSYNGEKIYFDKVVPVISDDRTYLPLRTLMETMGFTVSWEASTGIVTCVKGSRTATISPEGEITVDGIVSPYTAVPVNMNGFNLVPARAIAEAVNAEVFWNNNTRMVEITY